MKSVFSASDLSVNDLAEPYWAPLVGVQWPLQSMYLATKIEHQRIHRVAAKTDILGP